MLKAITIIFLLDFVYLLAVAMLATLGAHFNIYSLNKTLSNVKRSSILKSPDSYLLTRASPSTDNKINQKL